MGYQNWNEKKRSAFAKILFVVFLVVLFIAIFAPLIV